MTSLASATIARSDTRGVGFTVVPHGFWTLDIPHGARTLLGWLHSHSDAFLATLTVNKCRRCLGMSSAITGWLEALEAAGFISVARSENGRGSAITLEMEPWRLLGAGPHQNWRGDLTRSGEVTSPDLARIEEHVEDQKENTLGQQAKLTTSPRSVADSDDGFDAFWSTYPLKVAKKNARKAWSRMSKVDRAAAMRAVPRHIAALWGTKSTQFVPHPATWLNAERWNDVLPSAAGGRVGWREPHEVWDDGTGLLSRYPEEEYRS